MEKRSFNQQIGTWIDTPQPKKQIRGKLERQSEKQQVEFEG
jgi:hypothetical protein